MKDTARLFRLVELTRSQVQYGYALSGIPKSELSDLAQHHYLVTFIAWRLARHLMQRQVAIDALRVLEISLVHDLGELFGGDIAMPYAKANPIAAKAAKNFERENQLFLVDLFPKDKKYTAQLFKEAFEPKSNEGLVAKTADYIEVTQYKQYVGQLTAGDVAMVEQRIRRFITAMKGKKLQQEMTAFIDDWAEAMKTGEAGELFEQHKANNA